MTKQITNKRQQQETLAIAEQIRRLNALTTSLNAPSNELAQFKEQAAALADKAEALSGESLLPHFNLDAGTNLGNLLPRSLISGEYNPMAAPVKVVAEGKYAIGKVTLHKGFEGPSNCAHGAIVAGIFDQVLAVANIIGNVAGFTANLNVDYLKPTPLEQPLIFKCWTDQIEANKVITKGFCYHEDVLLTKASGLFIRYRGQQAKN